MSRYALPSFTIHVQYYTSLDFLNFQILKLSRKNIYSPVECRKKEHRLAFVVVLTHSIDLDFFITVLWVRIINVFYPADPLYIPNWFAVIYRTWYICTVTLIVCLRKSSSVCHDSVSDKEYVWFFWSEISSECCKEMLRDLYCNTESDSRAHLTYLNIRAVLKFYEYYAAVLTKNADIRA